MKVRLAAGIAGRSHNGGKLADDEFAYIVGAGDGDNPQEIIIPCRGSKKYRNCILRITKGEANEKEHRWHWDGNFEEPTLTPSIGCDHRCGWHGALTKGELLP